MLKRIAEDKVKNTDTDEVFMFTENSKWWWLEVNGRTFNLRKRYFRDINLTERLVKDAQSKAFEDEDWDQIDEIMDLEEAIIW